MSNPKLVGALFSLGALRALSGCGAALDEASETTADSTEPLLNIPGSFYTTAPEYAWCGATVGSSSGNCHAGYSTNSTGATNTYTRLTTGLYQVFLPGLALGGNVQIGAVASTAHCNLRQISASGGGVLVEFVCRSPTATLVDTKFQLSYYRDTNVGGVLGAYALVHASSGVPSITDIWNSTGSGASIANVGTGVHRVTFPGQVLGADTVAVTAASLPASYCKLSNWFNGGSGVSVDVRCFSTAGQPMNGDFSISYNQNLRAEPRNTLPTGVQGGFSLVSISGGTNPSFSRNTCSAGPNSATQVATGQYNESFHARTITGPEFPTAGLVTARGTNANYCNLTAFVLQSSAGIDMRAGVKCFTQTGTQMSTEHATMVMQQSPSGGC